MPDELKKEKKQAEVKTPEKKMPKAPSFYQAVGRRKEATARVKLMVATSGEIILNDKTLKGGEQLVNNRAIENYFPGEIFKKLYLEPFRTTNTIGRFVTSALISGGGPTSQLGAFILGVSRALEKVDKEKFHPILKKKGYLTRDPRAKERRKAGFAQKARAKKQSPKR